MFQVCDICKKATFSAPLESTEKKSMILHKYVDTRVCIYLFTLCSDKMVKKKKKTEL